MREKHPELVMGNFNRTFEELKYAFRGSEPVQHRDFNRTFEELKYILQGK